MSNLQKFNETLEEFNQEVGQLKAVSDAYKKLQQYCPDRRIIQVPAQAIVEGGGGIHCITQQMPVAEDKKG